jgi:hypothetical protein
MRVLLERDGELNEAEIQTVAGLISTTMSIQAGLAAIDPRLPLADIAQSPALQNRYKDWLAPSNLLGLESDTLQEYLAYGLALLFERSAPDTLKASLQQNIANENLFKREMIRTDQLVTTGYVAQAFGALLRLQFSANRTPALARRVFTLLSARKKLMSTDYVAPASAAWSTPMSVTYDSQFYIGRCGTFKGPSAQNSTSVNQAADGKQCNYGDGTPGYANFDVATVETQFVPGNRKGDVASARYVIEVGARMRGGHRDGGVFGGAEDETSSVNYSLSGAIQIPRCGDLTTCNPLVWISLQDLTSDPEPSAVRRTIVRYQDPTTGTPTTLTSDTAAISRSAGPINLTIEMSRSAQHVGACCEKDWAHHAIVISANSPIPSGAVDSSPDLILDDMYFAFLHDSPPRGLSTGPRPLLAQQLAQVSEAETEFTRRFRGIYARLLQAYVYMQANELALSGAELTALREAQGQLTQRSNATCLEPARAAYQSTQAAAQDLDLPTFIATINKAIEDLLESPAKAPSETVGFVADLSSKISSGGRTPEINNFIAAVQTAAYHSDRQQTILALMELRGRLRFVLLNWQRQLRDLATEITQMDPGGRDPALQ